jgi:copper chaperone
METNTFKTNIKCSGCVEKVRPYLDAALGENQWKVDLNHPMKTLTISSDADEAAAKKAMQEAGYRAIEIPGN